MKKVLLKIYTTLLASLPILSGYAGIASVDLGSILLFLWGIVCFLAVGNAKLYFPKGYLPFLFFSIVCTTIVTLHFPLGLILFVINMVLALNYTNLKYLFKIYSILVYCSCVLFILQEISYTIWGVRISGLLPGLPLVYQDISNEYKQSMLFVDRSSSFFLEPAYFVEYLFPYIIIKLFAENKRSGIEAIAVSAIMLFARSGTGVLLLFIIWGVWFFLGTFNKSYKITIAIVLGVVFFALISYGHIDNTLYSRVQELSIERGMNGVNSSGFIRFYRGYFIYFELPFINGLFGTSVDEVNRLVASNYYFSDNKNLTFFNGAQTLLIYYGFLSFIFYMRHLLLYCYNVKPEVKVIAFCCVYLMLTESFFPTSKLLLCTVLMVLISRYGNILSLYSFKEKRNQLQT